MYKCNLSYAWQLDPPPRLQQMAQKPQNMKTDPFSSTPYCDVILVPVASQITSFTSVYSTVYSDADQRKHQSSGSLAFVRGIHRGPVNFFAQMASNAENVSISWRHHGKVVSWSDCISFTSDDWSSICRVMETCHIPRYLAYREMV